MSTNLTTETDCTAAVGCAVEELDTPALLLDWNAAQRNLRRMADHFADRRCRLRPHFKNHKCTTLARKQLEAGKCIGITCAKLDEAQILADAGFDDVLIANQVMGTRKVARLAQVARQTRLAVAVDHVDQARQISQAADAADVTIGVLVEVDTGMGRCGVMPAPANAALELARLVNELPGVEFRGLQSFEGHVVYFNDYEERAAATRQCQQLALDTRQMIEDAGLHVPIISGGSTSTYTIIADLPDPGIDELQCGTYVTMDWRYAQLTPEFEVALSVLGRVISARRGEAVLDMGVKGAGAEFGDPIIRDHPDVVLPFFKSEEHCVLHNTPNWRVGDVVHLIPSHACTTCNLHPRLYVHEDGKVADVWPIEASGRMT